MTAAYYLRMTLPSAVPYGEELVAVRGYELRLFVNQSAGFRSLDIGPIQYGPAHISTMVVVMRGGAEVAQFSGANGVIPVQITADRDQPAELVVYNFDMDAPASYTINLRGWLAYEFPGS